MSATRHVMLRGAVVSAAVASLYGGAAGGVAHGPSPDALTLSAAVASVEAGELPGRSARAAATWCGSATREDLTPNVVAGHPVHWVYAFPADGLDRMTELGSVMQTDAEAIDAWWRSNDSARVPRNDLARFACGVQIDLTTLRLQGSSAALATERVFRAVFDELSAAGLRSPFTKYLVYFDGPVANDRVCGQGGSDSTGFGLAVVYLRACSGVSTAAVAAHELLHTLGAVPRGAPHECPDPNSSHTCDDPNDIMHPFIDESPLTSKAIDPGRDDYYGHSGGFTDTQDAPWLVRLDGQAPFQLAIAGPGSVAADVPGLECAQPCSTTWNAGTALELTPVARTGARFVRWGGACRGSAVCRLAVTPGAAATALFAPQSYRLTVGVGGRGTVRSTTARIACRPRCSAAVTSHVPVRLVAAPAKGWRLRSWTGACRGTRPTCTVPMSAATRARAIFVRR
jgi:hypothetical protein